MENPRQNNSLPDHEHLAELKAKVNQMDESNFDEKIFHEYLDALGDAAKPKEPIDVEASLDRFRSKHALLIARLDEKKKAQSAKTAKNSRRKRWGYRLVVVAAVIIILNAMCIAAFGHSMFSYAAKWGEETFGFFHKSDFETSEDGNIVYYPDGSSQNRTGMPEYDRGTYTEIPQEKQPLYDQNATLGSNENPLPLPAAESESQFANIPDTDVAALGLEKESSEWNQAHTMEYIYIVNSDIIETAEAFGVSEKLFPTVFPEGFVQAEVRVTKDYRDNTTDFSAYYTNPESEYVFSVDAMMMTGASNGVFEKDDRPVITYTVGDIDWYIMHNLENVYAVALIGNREVSFGGPVSVEKMKQIVDSVYERN